MVNSPCPRIVLAPSKCKLNEQDPIHLLCPKSSTPAANDGGDVELLLTLVRMQSSSATLEDNLADSHKIICTTALWPISHALGAHSNQLQTFVYKNLHVDAYRCFTQDHPNLEATKISSSK